MLRTSSQVPAILAQTKIKTLVWKHGGPLSPDDFPPLGLYIYQERTKQNMHGFSPGKAFGDLYCYRLFQGSQLLLLSGTRDIHKNDIPQFAKHMRIF